MKQLKAAYIGYFDTQGDKQGFKIRTFRNTNATNSYTIDYVHHVSKAFNFLLGRVAYFSDRFNKPIPETILTGKDLAHNIGCSVSHASSYVIPQLKELFNLEYSREGNSHGARTIRINKRIIDFLKIYSEEDFQAFLMLHNLMDHEYILRRLYERRIWEVTDSQLSKDEQKAKKDFMNQEDIRNYHSYVFTSNRSQASRIDYIEKSIKYLSEIERRQLDRIKSDQAEACKEERKLSWYFHQVLIKLEQKISAILRGHKAEPKQTPSQSTKQNQTQGETEGQQSATRAARKIPESDPDTLTYQEAIQFFMIWNWLAPTEHLDRIKTITINRYQLLGDIVKSHSKGDLFQALSNIRRLYHDPEYKYKVSFNQFATSRFLNVLEATEPDSRLESQPGWEDGIEYLLETKALMNSVPEFESIEEANEWFKMNS
jgi:hypothetical protein